MYVECYDELAVSLTESSRVHATFMKPPSFMPQCFDLEVSVSLSKSKFTALV